jgi:outer membrane receptor for ferrienterochelin and colicin
MLNNIKTKFFTTTIVVCYSVLSLPAHADDFYDLSLTDLLNTEIYTASQEVETAASSAAIVSVITSEQLNSWGVKNVYEALSFLPGSVLNETYMGYSVLTFRGINPGLYNNKTLFMIDSHPVYERLFGSGHTEYVPLEAIERIEVVRSPASALYGSQAISGAVNIITKKGREHGKTLSVSYGSNQYRNATMTWHDDNFSINASTTRDNGFDYDGTTDEFNRPVDFDHHNDLDNFHFYFNHKDFDWFTLSGAWYSQDENKFGLNPIIEHHGSNEQDAFYLDAKFTFQLLGGEINFSQRWDHQEKTLNANAFPPPGTPPFGHPIAATNEVDRYTTDLNFRKTFTRQWNVIIGMTYENDRSDPLIFEDKINGGINPLSPFTHNQKFDTLAAYGQVQYKPTDKTQIILGARIEDNSENSVSDVTPRFGVSHQITDDTTIKLLYSSAFRSPVFLERYANVQNVLYGDEHLEREVVTTSEFGVDTNISDNHNLQATLFYSELDDEITREPAPGGGTQYINGKTIYMHGIELSWLGDLNESWSIFSNASYTDGNNNNTGDDALYVANVTANIALTYKVNKNLKFTLNNQYVGKKDYQLNNGEKGSIDDYNLMNFISEYKAGSHYINLGIKNLLDENYVYPESVRRNIDDVPGGDGLSAYIKYQYSF